MSAYTYDAIEDLNVGDAVIEYDLENREPISIATITGVYGGYYYVGDEIYDCITGEGIPEPKYVDICIKALASETLGELHKVKLRKELLGLLHLAPISDLPLLEMQLLIDKVRVNCNVPCTEQYSEFVNADEDTK